MERNDVMEAWQLMAKARCKVGCKDYNVDGDYCISLRAWWDGTGPMRYEKCPNLYRNIPPTQTGVAIRKYIRQYKKGQTP
jgi:hypothetical protein